MDIVDIRSERAGTCTTIPGGLCAFVPEHFPPDIRLTPELLRSLAAAEQALGGLDAAVSMLPAPELMIQPFIYGELTASCRIEGAAFDLQEALGTDPEAPLGEDDEVQDLFSCLAALRLGLDCLNIMGFGLDTVRRIHAEAMRPPRGVYASPGEFRQIQIFVGVRQQRLTTASYVPPPQGRVTELMAAWERYAQEDRSLPPLLQCGLLHAQFEMIHPFRDGNGKLGRLLMPVFLASRKRLERPVLFLSPWFERNRRDYYDLLRGISHHGEWEEWLVFFLDGVAEQSRRTLGRLRELVALRQKMRARAMAKHASSTALRLLDTLFANPYTSTTRVTAGLGVTVPTARGALSALQNMGIVKEITGKKRGQRFCATKIQACLVGQPEEKDLTGLYPC